jgi:hypothetical protein
MANQAYTLPGGMGTIRMNGSVNVAIPAVSSPMGGSINLVQPAAPPAGAGGIWTALSNMLKW